MWTQNKQAIPIHWIVPEFRRAKLRQQSQSQGGHTVIAEKYFLQFPVGIYLELCSGSCGILVAAEISLLVLGNCRCGVSHSRQVGHRQTTTGRTHITWKQLAEWFWSSTPQFNITAKSSCTWPNRLHTESKAYLGSYFHVIRKPIWQSGMHWAKQISLSQVNLSTHLCAPHQPMAKER